MNPSFGLYEDRLTLIHGDWIEQLRFLPSNWFHCCVTSPPYWGLRDYKNPPTTWPSITYHPMPGAPDVTTPAWTGCLGLEPTIEMFVAHIVYGFREVYRVLRDDATLWLNLGDSYASNGGHTDTQCNDRRGEYRIGSRPEHSKRYFRVRSGNDCDPKRGKSAVNQPKKHATGLKSKDLSGIPWRVAFALQAEGWYLRCDTIWSKPNPMPESCTDRPTKSHEYLFLLTKSESYFYDSEAAKEPSSGTAHGRGGGVNPKAVQAGINSRIHLDRDPNHPTARKSRQNESFSAAVRGLVSRRNRRSVWTIPTQPYRGAHFATFPVRLVEPCIMAGTSAHGCCPHCGAPFERIIRKGEPDRAHQLACGSDLNGEYHGRNRKNYQQHKAQPASTVKARILAGMVQKLTIGWEPTCHCGPGQIEPCRVLDPFGGSGTVAEVALRHGCVATLVELNPDYIKLAQARCTSLLNQTDLIKA